MKLEKWIEGYIDSSVRRNNFIGKIVVSLRKIGITQFVRKIWVRISFIIDSLRPTGEMKTSELFYKDHSKDIKEILNMLADDQSKKIYKDVIRFRCTHKLKYFPDYDISNQYFDKNIVPVKDDYVFLDGGSYIGDTVESFLNFCNGKYSRIICFEPDPQNISALEKNTENRDNICIVKKGLWNERTSLFFSMEQTASKIADDGSIRVDVTAIDDEDVCSDASFIKMDIEGAELNALMGAVNTIKANRPVMAICIYHSDNDMINIIKWIKNLDLDYSLYVRHHNFDINETVLYAIPN